MVSTRIFTEPAGFVQSRSWKEKQRAGALDDLLHRGECRLTHAALVARQADDARQPRQPCPDLGETARAPRIRRLRPWRSRPKSGREWRRRATGAIASAPGGARRGR